MIDLAAIRSPAFKKAMSDLIRVCISNLLDKIKWDFKSLVREVHFSDMPVFGDYLGIVVQISFNGPNGSIEWISAKAQINNMAMLCARETPTILNLIENNAQDCASAATKDMIAAFGKDYDEEYTRVMEEKIEKERADTFSIVADPNLAEDEIILWDGKGAPVKVKGMHVKEIKPKEEAGPIRRKAKWE